MFLTIKKFSNVESQGEVIQKVQDGLLPTIKNFPGFINFYATKFEDGDLGSVSIFATKEQAENAADKTADWITKNLAPHMSSEPTMLRGEVVFQARDLTAAISA